MVFVAVKAALLLINSLHTRSPGLLVYIIAFRARLLWFVRSALEGAMRPCDTRTRDRSRTADVQVTGSGTAATLYGRGGGYAFFSSSRKFRFLLYFIYYSYESRQCRHARWRPAWPAPGALRVVLSAHHVMSCTPPAVRHSASTVPLRSARDVGSQTQDSTHLTQTPNLLSTLLSGDHSLCCSTSRQLPCAAH